MSTTERVAHITARRWNAVRAPLAVLLVASGLTIAVSQSQSAYAAGTVTINGATTYQSITGFGASEAFGEASTVMSASAAVQQQVLSLLYSPTSGAGLTMLRNEISADSGSTIEPTSPGSPTAAPSYVSLASINQDQGQLWFAQQIKSLYGVNNVFADAWSAPAFMKTNNSTSNGGAVCGLTGATCGSGNWVQAYSNYLVQYAQDYAAAGVPLTYIGPENEANLSTSYDSMQLSPSQTAQLLDTLGPAVANSGLSTQVECCATEGWDYASQYASAIASDSTANSYTKVLTSHGYTAAPTSPLSGWSKPTWQTEWSTFDGFNSAWDDGSDASGFTWAQHIHQGLTGANLSAFLYWWGSTTPSENGDNEGLLEINGSSVIPTGRLWAFANYSRYIHPGATRIAATTADSGLNLSAYKNTDGTVAVVVLNTANSADTVSYALQNAGITSGTVTPVLTNGSNNAAAQTAIPLSGGSFSASIPARSLVTYVISGSGSSGSPSASPSTSPSSSPSSSPSASPSSSPSSSPSASPSASTGGATCNVSYVKSSEWPGGFVANLTIKNTGTSTINGWTLKFAYPGDQKVTNAWSTTVTQSGTAVTATNVSYDGTISPGGTVSVGWQGTWTSSDATPTAFTLNGAACSTS
ncbi:MAG TPA: cellulose binding domain-containing protein [Actinocrinis sp.]|uniref:cellulose binding domain-containing protein n=1 Tax=Actinocrinis sp. TaxID=1920516 RepID=UPI002D622E67|nr:cellulose binding domain-containing protein [Actinocrinis sp.]HZU54553.1 cellulose binding domain-containing protein [Actinocrinis sp.]